MIHNDSCHDLTERDAIGTLKKKVNKRQFVTILSINKTTGQIIQSDDFVEA